MICTYCKKSYEKNTRIVYLFGDTFCLHDSQIEVLDAVKGMSVKNDSLSVKIARSGKNSTEEKYIQESKKRGSTVVRASDGLLREVTTD